MPSVAKDIAKAVTACFILMGYVVCFVGLGYVIFHFIRKFW